MKGRIEQADHHGLSVHRLQQGGEVLGLQLLQFQEGLLRLLVHDDPAHHRQPVPHEHVLGASQPDALRPQLRGARRILARVGVCPHAQAPHLIRPAQQHLQLGGRGGLHQLHLSDEDPSGGAVDGDGVSFLHPQAPRRGEVTLLGVDGDLRRAGDRGRPHSAGHHRRMAGLPSVAGQDPLGGE